MSKRVFPIIAVTGSSGAGTSTVRDAFSHIFYREGIQALLVEGDSYHRYTRSDMKKATKMAKQKGRNLSHFSPEANLLDELAELFRNYRAHGQGKTRHYLHNDEEALQWGLKAGTFTPWEETKEETDLLLYEGLHGGMPEVLPHVDLLIGVVPIINLEWIQKIQRDNETRGYDTESIVEAIKRRMDDYVEHITPQFSLTDINFQRIPTVDTSNPFISREVPSADESLVVIRVKKKIIKKYDIDLVNMKHMIENSFISRRNTLVIPGTKMSFAMEVLLTPIIEDLVKNSKNAHRVKKKKKSTHQDD
ncbi:MAG: phosphoribulokinase [Sedimenticola sp.]|nr:phosphoribulokinase [Sedimenticola sp.]